MLPLLTLRVEHQQVRTLQNWLGALWQENYSHVTWRCCCNVSSNVNDHQRINNYLHHLVCWQSPTLSPELGVDGEGGSRLLLSVCVPWTLLLNAIFMRTVPHLHSSVLHCHIHSWPPTCGRKRANSLLLTHVSLSLQCCLKKVFCQILAMLDFQLTQPADWEKSSNGN